MSASLMSLTNFHHANTSVRNRAGRLLWGFCSLLVFRYVPRPLHAWRAGVLRLFGARIGARVHIYGGARIWAPWNLVCDDDAAIADGAVIYNPALIHLQHHAIVSQDAYLCGATHEYENPSFPMISAPIYIGPYAWICARAIVSCGVTVGEGAILGLGSVATRDLEPWSIYGGVPARLLKKRQPFAVSI